MTATENTSDEINLLNEKSQGLPLKGQKSIPYKVYGVFAMFAFVILVNVFLLPSKEKAATTSTEAETFNLKSMDPSHQHQPVATPSGQGSEIRMNQESMRQKLEEAKAKDFINRLQAGQSFVSSNTQERASFDGNSRSVSRSDFTKSGSSASSSFPENPNTAYLENASQKQAGRSFAQYLGPQPYIIGQGKFIFATLAVAINSDLPGQLTAIVSQNVYGEKGKYVLIPKGSRLVGEYRSGLSNNQSRLFVVWTRVILPNGLSVMLGSEGADALGQAGLTGKVNYHFFARFGTASLLSLIGAGASTIGVNPSDEYNSMAAYRQAVSQALSKQASDMFSSSAHIPPTVHVKQGSRVVVFVNKDLDFSRVYR